jgi:hypothetical protein
MAVLTGGDHGQVLGDMVDTFVMFIVNNFSLVIIED